MTGQLTKGYSVLCKPIYKIMFGKETKGVLEFVDFSLTLITKGGTFLPGVTLNANFRIVSRLKRLPNLKQTNYQRKSTILNKH